MDPIGIIMVVSLAISMVLMYIEFIKAISRLQNIEISEETKGIKDNLVNKVLYVGATFFIISIIFLIVIIVMFVSIQ